MSLSEISPDIEKALKDGASFVFSILEGLGYDDWFKFRICELIMVALYVGNNKPTRPEPKKFFNALAKELIELVEAHPDYIAQISKKP